MDRQGSSSPKSKNSSPQPHLSESEKIALGLRIGSVLRSSPEEQVFANSTDFTLWLMQETGIDNRDLLREGNKYLHLKEYTGRPVEVEGGIKVPLTPLGLRWLQENLPTPEEPSPTSENPALDHPCIAA